MNADCAFAIGSTHQVCQDYAKTARTGTRVSAWLADGCSSSPDTDWGARLLVQAAVKHEASVFGDEVGQLPEAFVSAVSKTATRAVKHLQLAPTCLDATLLGIIADEAAGRFSIVVYGDGVAVLGRRDGTVEVHEIAYARNYPLYLNYRTDVQRQARWQAEAGNERTLTVTRLCGTQVLNRNTSADISAQPLVLGGDPRDFRFASVFSDGVTSFTRAVASDPVRPASHCTLFDVLPDLLAVKNWTGAFVQRRLQRFAKEAQARGLRHQDDLAVAMVHFGE